MLVTMLNAIWLTSLAFLDDKPDSAKAAAPPKPAAFNVEVSGTGQPMILIPGLTCGGNVWDGTVKRFKDRHQCHVVTIAGFAGQPAIGEPFLEKVRDALLAYIGEKKLERPVIVGHSLGGFLAFWLAATAPDRVGPVIAVDGVPFLAALFDPAADPKSGEPQAKTLRDLMAQQTAEQFASQNRLFLQGMITDSKDVEEVLKLSSKSDPKAVAQAFYELMTVDLREKVKAIRTPVLLLGATASMDDASERKKAEDSYRAQVKAIPSCKVVFAAKARHFIQLDEPDFFFKEVDAFLTEARKAK